MISEELLKLKRKAIMAAFVLVVIGILMIICPDEYISIMIKLFSAVVLIVAVLGCLEFLSSNKAMIQYLYLIGWMILGIVGAALMVFEFQSLNILSILAGIILIVLGIYSMFSSLTYARRSGRGGWWLLVVFAIILIACGVLSIINPQLRILGNQFRAIGILMIISSVVYILRFIWLWPAKAE